MSRNRYKRGEWRNKFMIFSSTEKEDNKKNTGLYKTVGSLPALGGLLFLSCAVIYGSLVLTGHQYIYLDVGSDTLHSFYSVYCWAVEHIRSMDFSFWSFEIGMGGSIFNYASVLLDPFALPVLAAGIVAGTKVITGALLAAQVIRVFACGFLCYGFLGYYDISPKARVIASYCYAFNGFMMLWGQHYWLATATVWVILELLFLEKARERGRISGKIAFTTAWMLMQSPYIGYMVLLFCGIYMLFRLLAEEDFCWRTFLKKASRMILSVLLGLCISAVVFLPTAYLILKVSSRLDSGASVLDTFWAYFSGGYSRSEFVGIILRFFSNNAQGIGSDFQSYDNYYEVPQFFFSSVFVICLSQLVWIGIRRIKQRECLLRKKIIIAVAALLVVFLIFNPAGSLIFNAFAYPFGRYTFVLMPVWALIMGRSLTELGKKQWSGWITILSAGAVTIVYLWSAWKNGETTQTGMLMLLLAGTVVLFAAGALGTNSAKLRIWQLAIPAMIAGIFISLTADGFCTVNLRGLIETDSSVLTREGRPSDTMEALRYLEEIDPGVYRVEKTYTDVSEVMDSMVFGYNGVSGYNSMLNSSMQKFHQELWPGLVEPGGWFRQYYTAVSEDWVMSSLCGIKYLLTDEPEGDYGPFYEEVATFGTVTILRNTQIESIGFLTPYVVSESWLETLDQEERTILVRKAAVVDSVNEEASEYVRELNGEIDLERLPDVWTNSEAIELTWEQGKLQGTVTAEQAGLLVLTIPIEQGWTILVDGQEQELVAADYGFAGVYLDAGVHEIIMSYEPPMFWAGVGISMIGVILLLAILLIPIRKKKVSYVQKVL